MLPLLLPTPEAGSRTKRVRVKDETSYPVLAKQRQQRAIFGRIPALFAGIRARASTGNLCARVNAMQKVLTGLKSKETLVGTRYGVNLVGSSVFGAVFGGSRSTHLYSEK